VGLTYSQKLSAGGEGKGYVKKDNGSGVEGKDPPGKKNSTEGGGTDE